MRGGYSAAKLDLDGSAELTLVNCNCSSEPVRHHPRMEPSCEDTVGVGGTPIYGEFDARLCAGILLSFNDLNHFRHPAFPNSGCPASPPRVTNYTDFRKFLDTSVPSI